MASNTYPDELLDAAERILSRSGRLGVAAVAEEAGVSRATAHRHLGGLSGLLELLATRRGIDLEERTRPDGRTRILDAVGAYIREKGLIGVSLDDIARRAEVGPATLYRTFTDREGLLRAYSEQRGLRRRARELDTARPLRPQLLAFVEDGLRFARENTGLMRLALSASAEDRGLIEALGADPTSSRRSLAAFLERASQTGALHIADPELAAHALAGSIMGCAFGLPDRDPADIAPSLVASFLAGWAHTPSRESP